MTRFLARLLLIALVIVTTLLPIPGARGQTGMGDITPKARDAYTGYKLDPCVTAIKIEDGSEYDLGTSDLLPAGTYDVVFTDCQYNAYAPATIHGIEVLAFDDPNWISSPRPVAWMTLESRSAIAGYVVDGYSGYPVEQACVQLVDPETDAAISEHWTNEDGLYQAVVDAGTTVKIRVKTKRSACNTPGPDYKFHYHPDTTDPAEAETITTREGEYIVSHFPLEVYGGFVGRVVDPSGEIGASGYCIYAHSPSNYSTWGTRTDGSFTIQRTGSELSLRFRSCNNTPGYAEGFLTESNNPSQVLTWDILDHEVLDLGVFSLDRPPALTGRVIDQHGVPVNGATVFFVAADGPAIDPVAAPTTDPNGWYLVNEPLTGSYTAFVALNTWPFEPFQSFAPTWLGNTSDRSKAEILELDGSAKGEIDFVVHRGEHATLTLWDPSDTGPISTDWEMNGATPGEPLEITATGEFSSFAAIGTYFSDSAPFPGFVGLPAQGAIVYDPPTGSAPLSLNLDIDPAGMPGPVSDMQTTWNGRRLASCDFSPAPCFDSLVESEDVEVTLRIDEGGDLAFVWGPRFLDTGDSTFVSDVEWLAAEGVTKGCTPPINDLFCPTDQVTRGQMAAFLVRFLGLTDRGTAHFADDDGSVFEADIEKLATAGITKGCNPPVNDHFCPNDPVTREQMAAFLTRALGLPAGSSTDFIDDNGSIFEDAIERLAAAGITRGCNPPTNDRFCPQATVTREQMAAFLHRAGALRAGGTAGTAEVSPPGATLSAVSSPDPPYVIGVSGINNSGFAAGYSLSQDDETHPIVLVPPGS